MQVNNLVQVQSFFVELFRPIFEEVITDSINKINEVKPASTPTQAPKSEGYITETEARKLLGGISKPTAWKYRKHGIIQGYRFGRMVRYKESEILASLSKITAKK